MTVCRKTVLSFFVFSIIAVRCGKAPGPLPDIQIGSLRITATGASRIDSIRVVLDDKDVGRYPNPANLSQIAAGFHKLFLFIGVAATSPQSVEVRRGEITPVAFLFDAGPYPGNAAPLFAVRDVKGDSISLTKQKGKVVLLIFFEHT
jgi:hypothetical protein